MSEDPKFEHDDDALHVAARMSDGLVYLRDRLLAGFAVLAWELRLIIPMATPRSCNADGEDGVAAVWLGYVHRVYGVGE